MSTMKNSWFIGALALIASGTAAANGFYVGAGLGVINQSNKSTNTILQLSEDIDGAYLPYSTSQTNSALGINGTLLGGYSWLFANHFVIALEAFVNSSNAKVDYEQTTHVLNVTSDFSLSSTYGLRLLPGYQVTPETKVYGIVGYARASGSLDNNADATVNGGVVPFTNKQDYQFNGYQLGFGSETQLSEHFSLRGDVIYTGYDSQSVDAQYTFLDSSMSATNTVQPSSLEANVILVYQFG